MKCKLNAGWVVQGKRKGSRPRTKDDGRSSQESKKPGDWETDEGRDDEN